jgi:soluble lytic murein transglycosylase-like protein
MLPTGRFRELIAAIAHYYNLPQGLGFTPEEWLEGLILTESSGNPVARRFELHQDKGQDPDIPQKDDLDLEDDCSYGLMQVMGYNARKLMKLPYMGVNFSFMYNPLINIGLGLMLLQEELKATNGDLARALARYNGGPTGEKLDPSGSMRCASYVAKVVNNSLKVRHDR